MNVHVDLLPSPPYDDVVVLIDVLKASTAAAVLFENGLEQLHLTPSTKLARHLADGPDTLLVGEREGFPPEGFNVSSSPARLRTFPVARKSAVLVSENAPRALSQLSRAKHVLLGSFFNARAVLQRAAILAKANINLVCCGQSGQEALDDSLTAGFLAAQLKALEPSAKLSGAARLTLGLLQTFPDPLEALWRSDAGRYLRRLDLADDLAVASLINQTRQVPELVSSNTSENGSIYTFTP